MLTRLESLPEGFLDCSAQDLHRLLPGPALIHLPGRRTPALFVSILLHGNEESGLQAVQALLRRYAPGGGQPLPRALSLFVGNVAAARRGVRLLDGQPDFNRIGPGGPDRASSEARAVAAVVDEMRERGVFASVDLHNNTGLNPHYACVNRLDHRFLHLAALFSRTVVYFVRPRGVQTAAFADLCPAVTLECGQVGQARGRDHALDYLDACLHLAELPAHPVAAHDIDLFHTVAVVRVPPAVPVAFEPVAGGLQLVADLDHLNFRELPAGTQFGWIDDDGRGTPRVRATDESGADVTDVYFAVVEGRLVTRRPLMPSMLTLDVDIIRQDCLCYLMERLDPADAVPG